MKYKYFKYIMNGSVKSIYKTNTDEQVLYKRFLSEPNCTILIPPEDRSTIKQMNEYVQLVNNSLIEITKEEANRILKAYYKGARREGII